MKKEVVDEAIDIYVAERMVKGKQKAVAHFLAFIYMKKQSAEIAEAMRRVRGMTRYYIDLAKVVQNPFKGPEMAWLFSMINIAIYSIVLITIEEQRTLGIALLSGTLVNAGYLLRNAVKKWCELSVTLAIYAELLQLADSELQELS